MEPVRRVGAILLLAGGLLGAVLPFVLLRLSVPAPTPAGIGLLAASPACISAGLISMGILIHGRARPALLVAGALYLAAAIVNSVQIAIWSPLGPGPSQLADLAQYAAVIVAAILALTDSSQPVAIRRAICVPATAIALFLASALLLPLPALELLPDLGFAVGGALLLRATRPVPALGS